jgi:ABC-type transport system substrate-binding protein
VWRQLLWGLTALALLAGCDPAADAPPAIGSETAPSPVASSATTGGGTLRWAIREPAGITPATATDESGLVVVDALFDSLTGVDAQGGIHPRAAVRWRALDDGRRWRFTLRRGGRFHDGSPVTARDFVAAWTATVDQGRTGGHLQDVVGYDAVRQGRADTLAGVRAIDATTLEVRLRRPAMDLPAVVAHPSLGPVPAGARPSRPRFAAQPVGNGPYRMPERRGPDFIRVERFDRWRNGGRDRSAQRVREILFRALDPDAAYVAFQQGRIDVAGVPAGALQQALRTYGPADGPGGAGVVDGPTPDLYFLGVRVDRPPFDAVEVRRALSRAIDRQALADAQGDLALDPARRIVPAAVPDRGRVPCDSCLHLPSLARAAFGEAGVTELTLTIDAGGGHDRVARAIQADLAAVGVDLTIEELPFEEYLARLASGDVGLYRFGWQTQYPTPGAALEPVVGSGAPAEAGDGANYGGYASPVVDELLAAAERTADPTRRRELWAAAEARALADQAIVPLFGFRQRTVVSTRVRGLELGPWWSATPERARIVADPDVAG